MSRAHATAIKTALTGAGLTVYEGQAAANPTYPYVVLFTDAGRARDGNFRNEQTEWDHTFQTTSVALTHEQVLWAAEKVRTALVGKRLSVSGWTTGLVRNLASTAVAHDFDAPTNVLYKADQWRYVATPST